MAKKKFDPAAKAKKQKKMAIIGGVLLLLVMGIQVPKTMKKLGAKTPPPPVVSTGPTTTTPGGVPGAPLTPPTLDGSTDPTIVVPGSVSGGGATVAAAAPEGTIASFDRFASKDPFTQQVQPKSAGSGSVPVTPTPTGAGAGATPLNPTPPVTPIPPGGTIPQAPGTGTGTPTAPAGPMPTTARIAVNGVVEDVGVGKDFPAANPIFHLVALTRTAAKIAIAGGSYADGAPTVALRLHKTLNLQNTSDGTVFTLKLVLLDPLSGAGTATPTAPVTTTTTDSAAGLSP